MDLITFSEITHSFDEKEIFSNFDLSIERGEKIQLASPSGRGKTTLFKMLLGFIRPSGGKILVEGIELREDSVANIRRRTAYLSQDIDFREGKTEEIVEEILNFHHNKNLGIRLEDIQKEADFLNLSMEIWNRNTSNLSGGERQRLGIALALSLKREIILLDEPTSALDGAMKKKVKERILKSEKTFMIVSHDSLWKEGPVRKVVW